MFTTTTTTTTTTQAPSIDPSSFYNFNQNHQEPFSIPSTEDPFRHFKNFFTSTTTKTTTSKPTIAKFHNQFAFDLLTDKQKTMTTSTIYPFESIIPTSSPRPTINPFYFGFNIKSTTPKTTTNFPFFKFNSVSTTKNPYDFREFEFNHLQTTPSTISPKFAQYSIPTLQTPLFLQFTTTTMPTTTTKKSQSTSIETQAPFATKSTEYPKSEPISTTTRNPVFDIYLKRVASTTKNPYDFGNFGQYFKKTTTIHTPFSFNLFGSNSNRDTLNTAFQQKKV